MNIGAMMTAVAALTMAAPAGSAAVTREQAMAKGRLWSGWLVAGDSAKLVPVLSPALLSAIGGAEGVKALSAQIAAQAGREVAVTREIVFREAGTTSYYRLSRFEKLPDVTTRWVFGDDGIVQGASIQPSATPAPSDKLNYVTKTRLRLPAGVPAGGRWYVAWGGRDAVHNYHVAAKDQRFAYDLMVLVGDTPFRGKGTSNAEHHCFGAPILSPAAGTVVRARDGIEDNVPGKVNDGAPTGNYVVIDHGGGEHSLLAHFQKGSVAVKPGQKIAAGAPIGRCGNSGRSTMPHLHYHLQTGADYGVGVGLPAPFSDYVADGRPVQRGEPVRGQYLLPAGAKPAR